MLTISGPAGAGKTTLVGNVLSCLQEQSEALIRVTTRSKRADDNEGEYEYVSIETFEELEWKGELLYPIEIHKIWHGMRRDQLERVALGGPKFLVADLSVVSVENMHAFMRSRGVEKRILSIFLAHCPEDTLRERMRARGEQAIEARILECRPWQAMAEASSVPFVFLDARQTAEKVTEQVLNLFTAGL
jgi:guanylate kinase